MVLLITLFQKRDSIDTNIRFLGMNFTLRTRNSKVKDDDDAKREAGNNHGRSSVVIKGTKISNSSIENIAGKDLVNSSGGTDIEMSSSEVDILDTEIKKSKIESLAGRNIKK